MLDGRPGWRKWKGTAVDEDGRADVVCVLLEISASEKRRFLVSSLARGEVGRLVVSKEVKICSFTPAVSGGGGGSGRIPKKDSGCFFSTCSSSTSWSRYFATEPAFKDVEGRLFSWF